MTPEKRIKKHIRRLKKLLKASEKVNNGLQRDIWHAIEYYEAKLNHCY